jgi:hypothetical protein
VAHPRAQAPLQLTTARVAVALRVGNVVVSVPTALLAAVPPVNPRWIVGGLVVLAAWTAVFAAIGLTRGLVSPLMAADAAVTIGFCLQIGRFVPVERIDEGSCWIAVVASFCVISLPMAWPARFAIPVGLLVIAAYAAGFPLAGLPGRGLVHTATMVVQLISSAVVLAVLRRASAAVGATLAEATAARQAALVASARRADENAQLRLIHDTALTTLTLVGTGAVGRSRALANRAAADLAAIELLATADTAAGGQRTRLDELLSELVRDAPGGLRVEPAMVPCVVPSRVADAFLGGVGEALRNVAQHAGVDEATLRLAAADGFVVVEVADAGRGFDPATAHSHRYGIRQSIMGRMRAVGGHARIHAAPGEGTQWTLEWREGSP